MRLRLPFCDLCILLHEFLVTGCQTFADDDNDERRLKYNIDISFAMFSSVFFIHWLRFPVGPQTLTYAVQIIIDISGHPQDVNGRRNKKGLSASALSVVYIFCGNCRIICFELFKSELLFFPFA